MRSDFAYAKFQGINGEEIFIKKLPSKLCQNKIVYDKPFLENILSADSDNSNGDLENITFFKCFSQKKDFGLIFFDTTSKKISIISFIPIYINEKSQNFCENSERFLSSFATIKEISTLYEDFKLALEDNSRIYFPCNDCDCPHVFYFFLPPTQTEAILTDQMNTKQQLGLFSPSKNVLNPRNKIPDRNLASRWTLDDREQLKKHLLVHGYGRWKKIMESSKMVGGKLAEKPIIELRAFSNSFIRSISDNLGPENSDLKNFLLFNTIEELPDDPYIAPNAKDWDLSFLKQRAMPWGKRLQLLHRVRILISKFKEEAKKNLNEKDKKINWDNMLNFLPESTLYGQKPQVWWTKKHDIDLLRGVYKYGYANYQTIRNAEEYCFKDLDKTPSYQDFPNSDTITRRLKKLIVAVMKNQQNKGKITFEMSSSDEEPDGWSIEAKSMFFKFLTNYGIPLSSEGRPNLIEFKEKFLKEAANTDSFDKNKSVSQIEKIIQKIRLKCQQIIANTDKNENNSEEHKSSLEEPIEDDLKISYDEAIRFSKNENLLHFIRKAIVHNNNALFRQGIEDLKKKHSELEPSNPAFMCPNYECEVHDFGLLMCVVENGLKCTEILKNNPFYGCEKLEIDEKSIQNRLEFICEFFKSFTEKGQAPKKRKFPRDGLRDSDLKKKRFCITRDLNGNVQLPLHINNSLTLLATGVINLNPNYHSEHNLFPIGFSTIRVYSSMKVKGVKVEYTNEILEGKEGKPLYRVTSSEDPDNPIIRESSTGCWVYICSRVNDLQDVKKEKVTISGTERFGLLDQNIIKLLEELPNSEKCTKYNFKFKNLSRQFEENE